ncbi:MAG: hypothetical protein GXP46_12340 [Deferribacteres bacterium]|nr:hypothetical protein [Deferribacteres bacterium]
MLVFFVFASCQQTESKLEKIVFGKEEKKTSKTVVVLFDLTGSTKKYRSIAFDSFKRVLSSIGHGDVIVAAKITESSITEPEIPLQETFPEFIPLDRMGRPTDNEFLKRAAKEKADNELVDRKKKILEEIRGVFFAGDAKKTDIISSLHVAARIFKAYRRDKSILVILSDMIEDSSVYNFEKENLTEKRIEEIIRKERHRKRIPDLRGVTVYIVPAGDLNTKRYFSVQDFWLSYFKECGASLSKENYGPLLVFNE